MHSRRNFLVQGSLATTAFLAANPFKSIASGTVSLLPGINSTNSVMLLHTSSTSSDNITIINKLKRQNSNSVLLNNDMMSSGDAYQIVFKGNIKIGVISTDNNSVNEINALAGLLKKEKNCHLIVCVSQLGFMNQTSIDDIKLAQQSEHVDVIISTGNNRTRVHPTVLLNKHNEEVIINPTNDIASVGKIDISFDRKGKKRQVAIGMTAALA
jgi:2',3'-cyclic-nucleotide 2'-phosphodiesterase (5'-nucleotidase family)